MWCAALFVLAGDVAEARPLPVVVVRPLPVREAPVLGDNPSKAELIAASWVERTVSHLRIGKVTAQDGTWPSSHAGFTCTVSAGDLTVSYTREGFDVEGLPKLATCGEGESAVMFRVRVEE
jgi:hypothetical protein